VVEKDLQQCVVKSKENWEEHQELADQLLKEQLNKYRLLRPSKTQTNKYGVSYIEMFLFERAEYVAHQVLLQVSSKCAERSFKRSKEVLNRLHQDINQLHAEKKKKVNMNAVSDYGEWVVL
jgi:hypothetical protein